MVKAHRIPSIAFIDDGINPDSVPEGVPFGSFAVDGGEVIDDAPMREVSHGTTCYEIFRDRVRASYHLTSLKVLDNTTGVGTNNALVTALRWCADQDIDLINMSMGTRQYSDFPHIVDAVNRLQNSVIVAACSNSNTLTFPACLPTVIGVRCCGKECLERGFAYIQNPYDQVDVMAKLCDSVGKLSNKSNSFAVPRITAHICSYLAEGSSGMDAIRQKLRADAMKGHSFADYDFYRSLLPNWESLSIPTVAVIGDVPLVSNKLKALLDIFNRDGYRAAALTMHGMENVPNLIFQLGWRGEGHVSIPALVELYYNFTLPDILFLHMDKQGLLALPDGLRPDIAIAQGGIGDACFAAFDGASVLGFDEDVGQLYMKIKSLLS